MLWKTRQKFRALWFGKQFLEVIAMKSLVNVGVGLVAGCCFAVLTGCSTMDSMYQGSTKMTNPDKMKLQVGLKWMNDMPNLRVPSADRRTVYVRYRNTSGSPLPNLLGEIRTQFEQAGYQITMNPDEASFVVQADARYFGEASRKDGTVGTIGGAVVGGVAGGVVGHNVGNGSNLNTGIGAVAGALIVGGAMDILANRNKMVEYDLVIDVRIGERIKGGVKTSRRAEGSAEVGHSAGFNAAGGSSEYGSSSASSGEKQQVETQDDFLYHTNRLTAFAVRMAMTPEDAMPVLSGKIATALGQLLP